jgi:ABC-type branched-subunit amino acid transport system ATPase component
VLELEELVVQFGGVRSLDGLTARLDGRVQGVIGPNGAGKTTLLNVLSGFLRPTAGRVSLDGTPLLGRSPAARARLGVRRTFQTEQLADELTAWENVMVMADATEHRARRRAVVAEACDLVGLAGSDVPARQLDGLGRKLAELARALVGRPAMAMLDEPAGGLSENEVSHVRDVLRSIEARGDTAILLVDHDVGLIESVCDSVAVLDYGRLVTNGPCAEVLQDERVREAWLGTVEVA